ncbi:hemin uptake protein HemP [Kaistia dalseonensis]|nr:hemin uptake protein HemP [Kaistia dalseonensis]MCX5495069.1 hemin uptake protein HemP [Kaistia dalseonensis]
MHTPSPADEKTEPIDPAAASELKVVSSADLFGGAREIVIRHAGENYRLRVTRAGKLILNK